MKHLTTDKLLSLGMALHADKRTMETRVRSIFARRYSAWFASLSAVVLCGAIGLLGFTTACQPMKKTLTDALSSYVASKNMQQMIEAAADPNNGTTIDAFELQTEQYTYSYNNDTATLNIHVDATVSIPDNPELPIVLLKDSGFDQELVSKVFRFLYPDKKPYLVDESIQTKEDYDKLLAKYRILLAEKDFSFFEEDELHYLISWIEERYDAAPERALPRIPKKSNGKMEQVEDETGVYQELSCQLPDTENNLIESLYIRSYGDAVSESSPGRHYGMRSSLEYYKDLYSNYTEEISLDYCTEVPKQYSDNLLIPLDDAKEICNEFFSACGEDNRFELGNISLIKNRDNQFGFAFIFTRRMADCDSALISIESGYGTADRYSLPWGYEYLQIMVDDTGIIQIRWSNPIEETGVILENCHLLSFDQIIARFEQMMPAIYGPKVDHYGTARFPSTIQIDIDSIKLQLLRIKEEAAVDRTGLAVPAWVFYGHIIRTETINGVDYEIYDPVGDAAFEYCAGPIIVFAINAIDGSVIDMGNGY